MPFELKGRVIFFATNNVNKFNEARVVFAEHEIAVGMLRAKTVEIQNDSLEEIARASVIAAFSECNLPVIVEDAGLFVEELNWFPGPYAAYVYTTIGNRGLLRLMENVRRRKARFQSAIAYYDETLESPLCFRGEVTGEIMREERTDKDNPGFGFYPIFKPTNSDKTFAQMNTAEKNNYSHRARALRKFAEFYGTF